MIVDLAQNTMFTAQDLEQIAAKGISLQTVQQQLRDFEQGYEFIRLVKPASVGCGILRFDAAHIAELVRDYDALVSGKELLKFVPASGAATRMFKDLLYYYHHLSPQAPFASDFGSSKDTKSVKQFFDRLPAFAFYGQLEEALAREGKELPALLKVCDYHAILEVMFEEDKLNYASMPKGLFHFHRYADGQVRTPLEEHILEGASYACNEQGKVHLHFTVSPEYQQAFEQLAEEKRAGYEALLGIGLEITFSQQKGYTDTIAATPENTPFRCDDGTLLFRPGGHGALLENLNQMEADIVFIKNIDNVVPDALRADTLSYKKVLASVLVDYQEQIFGYLKRLRRMEGDEALAQELEAFFSQQLCHLPPSTFGQWSLRERLEYFERKLDRPLRVCGMVKNEGEPGGGPAWVLNNDGTTSLQIVESAQVDEHDPAQVAILQNGSHFNPVDLVCGLKDCMGKRFNLLDYRDLKTGFITHKTRDGREVKAIELPGLWNGAMADWNTVFVEVPVSTFSPVKTVNDLLRPEHQVD